MADELSDHEERDAGDACPAGGEHEFISEPDTEDESIGLRVTGYCGKCGETFYND